MAHYMGRDRAAREPPTAHVKINYDTKMDRLSLIRKENGAVAASDEKKPAVLPDYDGQGDLLGGNSRRFGRGTEAKKIDFQIAG